MDVVTVELAPIRTPRMPSSATSAPAPETMVEFKPAARFAEAARAAGGKSEAQAPPEETPTEIPAAGRKAAGKGPGFAAARAGHSTAGQGRRAENGPVLADEPDAAIAAFQALPGLSAIAQRGGHCAVKL